MSASHFYTSCKQRESAFVLEYLFKGVCKANSLGRQRECPSLEQRLGLYTVQYNKDGTPTGQRAGRLTDPYKRFSYLSVGFLSCNATHCMYRDHLAPFLLLCGSWDSGN